MIVRVRSNNQDAFLTFAAHDLAFPVTSFLDTWSNLMSTARPKTLLGVHPAWSLGILLILGSLLIFQWI